MDDRLNCPSCGNGSNQHKIGKTAAGSQRYRCSGCKKSYTPQKKERGYNSDIRHKAICLYVNGYRARRIGYLLEIHHTTISNWINTYLDNQPHESYPELDRPMLDGS